MPVRNRSQFEVDRAVANATGEDLRLVRHRGFSLVNLQHQDFDPEPDMRAPQFIDWDELELSRNAPIVYQPVGCARRIA